MTHYAAAAAVVLFYNDGITEEETRPIFQGLSNIQAKSFADSKQSFSGLGCVSSFV